MPLVTASLENGPLAFWHAPKCGGTFVQRYLGQERGGYRIGNGHDPAWMGPSLPLPDGAYHFGVVRDPWSWYASLWRHARRMVPDRGSAWVVSHCGTTDDFRAWLVSVLSRTIDPPIGIYRTAPHYPLAPPGLGLWSWLIGYMYQSRHRDSWLVNHLIDTSRLYDGLEALLGTSIDRSKHRIHNHGGCREGVAEPATTDYRSWYDDEAAGLVATADAGMISVFGYTFGGQPPHTYRPGT